MALWKWEEKEWNQPAKNVFKLFFNGINMTPDNDITCRYQYKWNKFWNRVDKLKWCSISIIQKNKLTLSS